MFDIYVKLYNSYPASVFFYRFIVNHITMETMKCRVVDVK